MDLEQIREKLHYQPLLLGVVALLAGAALSWASSATREPIAAAEAHDMQLTLAQVLPEGISDNDLLKDVRELDGPRGKLKIHLARKAGKLTAAVYQVAERGYAADIVLLMAVDTDARVLGVRVLKHSETPGLGDKIELAKSPWITRFSGKSTDDPSPARWAVKKDGGEFDQFAGATVTPRAVVKAVKGGLDFFVAHRNEIVGAPADPEKPIGSKS